MRINRKALFENCNSYGVSGVYAITNKTTGERYIGSSRDIRKRWKTHLDKREWSKNPGMLLYQAFQKYGIENFTFTIVALVEPEHLKEVEQEAIEMFKPELNARRPIITDDERIERDREYRRQLCVYNNKEIKLSALSKRFSRLGIPHPTKEAKKYLKKY